jgi:hypothetical protein
VTEQRNEPHHASGRFDGSLEIDPVSSPLGSIQNLRFVKDTARLNIRQKLRLSDTSTTSAENNNVGYWSSLPPYSFSLLQVPLFAFSS